MQFDSKQFGVLLTIQAIFKLISSVLAGVFICQLGPKNMMISAFFINSISMLTLGINPSIYPEDPDNLFRLLTTYFSFSAQGISIGIAITVGYAIVVETFPDSFSVEVGFYEFFSGLASFLGPIVAWMVLKIVGDDFLYVGVTGAVLAVVTLLVAVFSLETDGGNKDGEQKPSDFKQAFMLLRNELIQLAFFTVLIGNGIIHILGATVENYTKSILTWPLENDVTTNNKNSTNMENFKTLETTNNLLFKLALPWTILGLTYMITSPIIGKFSQHHPRAVLFTSISTMTIAVLLTKIEPKFVTLCIVSGIVGATQPGPILASYQEMDNAAKHLCVTMCEEVEDLKPPKDKSRSSNSDETTGRETVRRGSVQRQSSLAVNGLIATCWNLGYSLSSVLAPATFGFIEETYSFHWSMRVYAVLLIILLGFMFKFYK